MKPEITTAVGWEPLRNMPPMRSTPAQYGPPAPSVGDLLSKMPIARAEVGTDAVCLQCRRPFTAHEITFGKVRVVPTVCDACGDLPERLAAGTPPDQFAREVKAGYANTDETHAGLHPEYLQAARTWEGNGDGKGLGLTGPSGHGKTRCCVLVLRRAAEVGAAIGFCSAIRLAELAAGQFDDDRDIRAAARGRIQYLATCRVLLLDDIGKEKLTERAAEAFSNLIEERTVGLLPILWTSQYDRKQLVSRFGEDRGTAIARRLSSDDFSTVVSLK